MNWTVFFILSTLAIIIAVDVVLTRTRGATISENTSSFVRRYPLAGLAITTAIGVLLGHLFWAQFPGCP